MREIMSLFDFSTAFVIFSLSRCLLLIALRGTLERVNVASGTRFIGLSL